MDYQTLTGDKSHQQDILNALGAQVGPKYDFVVPEQVFQEVSCRDVISVMAVF